MGFGLLFVGYLLAFGFTSGANYLLSLVALVGCTFIFAATKKLSQYEKSFNYCKATAIILGVSYIFNTGVQLCNQYDLISSDNIIIKFARVFIIISVFVYNLFMYRAIFRIAHSVDDKKLCKDALINFVLMVAYYFSMSLTFLSSYISLAASILAVVWLILSVWLTLSAYMRICLPGDEDMPDKKISNK